MSAEFGLYVERPEGLLRERVTSTLRDAILRGALEPGRRLTERELGELTGVSRTSLREALRHLQAEGLVEPHEARGLRVTVLSPSSAAQLYDVRSFLETAAVELFTLNASDEQVAQLGETLAVLGSHGVGQVGEGVRDFYDVVFEGAGNEVLREMYLSIEARIFVVRRYSLQVEGRAAQSQREFHGIFAAIQRRDVAAAVEETRQHVMAAKAAALAVIEAAWPAPA